MTADVIDLSHFGWAVLDQLKQQGRVWDGDLVCKSGRDEIVYAEFEERGDGLTVWLKGAGGAPSEQAIWIDFDPHHEVAAMFPVALIALSSLAPVIIVPGRLPWITYDAANRRIILRSESSETYPV